MADATQCDSKVSELQATKHTPPKTILVAGASGWVGRQCIRSFDAAGWSIRALSREPQRPGLDPRVQWFEWSIDRVGQAVSAMDGVDAVLNLVGEPIARGRLDEPHRRRVLHSRVHSVQHLLEAYSVCSRTPSLFMQMSATGYFGDAGEQILDEQSPPGKGILAEVCVAWEAALEPLKKSSCRVVIGRLGMALGPDAEAWRKLVAPIRNGLGGPFGSGSQWWSWIDVEDAARALLFLAEQPRAYGVFNLCAPEPVRQKELVQAIAQRLHRPSFAQVPAFVLRALGGNVADELLLSSCRAIPKRLLELGFGFCAPTVAAELERLIAP